MCVNILLWTVIILLIIFEYMRRWNRKKYPPGPFSWSFLGNQTLLKELIRKHGNQQLAFMKLSQKYKSDVIMLRLGMRKIIVVSGAAVHKLLRNHNFDGRPWNEFIKLRNMGIRKGITMNDGPEWKEVRTWVVRSLRNFGYGKEKMFQLIQNEMIIIIESLKHGGVHRMKPIITPVVLNVLWTFATGKRISEISKLHYFLETMERRSCAFDIAGGILSSFPWIRYIAPETSGYNLLVKINDDLKYLLMATINDHKANYIPNKENDLIDMFLREMYNEKESNSSIFTEDQLLLILLDLFIAGLNTTASFLDFLFMHMVVYQDVQRKIKKEISEKIGLVEFPKLEDRSKLDYAEAVITEVFRMYTITPIIGPRRILQDTIFENYSIPNNATILINLYSVHMNPDMYPNPHEFKPERFLKDGIYQIDTNLIPFGKGSRACPGDKLAKSVIFLSFISIMQKYTLLPVPDQGPYVVEYIPGLTISPKPYKVLVVPQ